MGISMCIKVNKLIISQIPQKNSKIIFVLGSYKYLEIVEGKIRKCLFFYVKIF